MAYNGYSKQSGNKPRYEKSERDMAGGYQRPSGGRPEVRRVTARPAAPHAAAARRPAGGGRPASAGRRPSARTQQRRAQGVLAVAMVAVIAVLCGFGVVATVSFASRAMSAAAQAAQQDAAAQEGQAKEQQEPVDERAAELALDPERTTEWNYDGVEEKVVYLTFDDGPSYNTKKILDILDSYDAKATFFVTGRSPEYRESIKDAYERGNTIGLHTMTHDYDKVYASTGAFFDDLEQVGEVVKEQIGYVPYLTRFPGGASNTVSANYTPGIMTELVEEVPARGYQFYDWNVGSADASGINLPPETIVESACVEGYRNVMLLFHDSNTKDTTVDALPQVIEFYKERGYEFRAIDRGSFVCHHGVNN